MHRRDGLSSDQKAITNHKPNNKDGEQKGKKG